jgi:hypothetical protein
VMIWNDRFLPKIGWSFSSKILNEYALKTLKWFMAVFFGDIVPLRSIVVKAKVGFHLRVQCSEQLKRDRQASNSVDNPMDCRCQFPLIGAPEIWIRPVFFWDSFSLRIFQASHGLGYIPCNRRWFGG